MTPTEERYERETDRLLAARRRGRLTQEEFDVRLARARARRDQGLRFDAAFEAGPAPAGELPFDRLFRQSQVWLQATLNAGGITPAQYQERLARITATRQERAIKWAKYEYRTKTPTQKRAARLFFRSVRAHHPQEGGADVGV